MEIGGGRDEYLDRSTHEKHQRCQNQNKVASFMSKNDEAVRVAENLDEIEFTCSVDSDIDDHGVEHKKQYDD